MKPDALAEASASQFVSPVDPAVAAQAILVEGEYLRTQAVAILTVTESAAAWPLDVSPLGI